MKRVRICRSTRARRRAKSSDMSRPWRELFRSVGGRASCSVVVVDISLSGDTCGGAELGVSDVGGGR